MNRVTLKDAWTWRTPSVTVNYPAGPNILPADALAAAEAAGVIETPEEEETDDGSGPAKTRSPRRSGKA